MQVQKVRHEFMKAIADGRAAFPTGLLDRVRAILRQNGRTVRIRDRTSDGRHRLVDRGLTDRPDFDRGLEFFVRILENIRRGQFRFATRLDVALFLAVLAEYYDKAKICVVVKSNAIARRLCKTARRFMRRYITTDFYDFKPGNPQFLVVTTATLHHLATEAWKQWDVLVFADCESARSWTGLKAVFEATYPLRFALLDGAASRDELEDLYLEAAFGPPIDLFAAGGSDWRPVEVHPVVMPSAKLPAGLNALERKRSAFWRNKQRNTLIAQIAEAIVARDVRALRRLGLFQDRKHGFPRTFCSRPRTVICVETPEHVRELAAILPEWQQFDLVPAPPSQRPTRDGDEDDGEDECLVVGDRAIVTNAFARRRPISADVVICAHGVDEDVPVNLKPDWVQGFAIQQPVLVIDVMDDFDDRAMADAQRRINGYRDLTGPVVILGNATLLGTQNEPTTKQLPVRARNQGKRSESHGGMGSNAS